MLGVLLLVNIKAVVVVGTAPGDEWDLCADLRAGAFAPIPNYTPDMMILMDSWNYQNLLPPRTGAVWTEVDNDMNNPVGLTTNVSVYM